MKTLLDRQVEELDKMTERAFDWLDQNLINEDDFCDTLDYIERRKKELSTLYK